jgi:hypothetical protein
LHIAAFAPTLPVPQDPGLLLAELETLTERAAVLRAQLAQAAPAMARRPGWPIRRVGDAPPRPGGGG